MLRAVRLDAMTAIYDRRSGMTHLVAEVVPTILTALGEGDADFETLAKRLFGNDTTPRRFPGSADRAALAERLEELADIGLVEHL